MNSTRIIMILGAMSTLLLACEKEPRIDYPDPIADFEPGVTTSFAGKPVLFPHELTEEAICYWDFGDNSKDTTTGWAPTHTYAQAGTYEVTLTVVGRDATDDATKTIQVLPPFEQLLAGETCKTWKLIQRYERASSRDVFQERSLDSCDQNIKLTFCADNSASDENWYCGGDIEDNFRKWEYNIRFQQPTYTSLDIVTKL